MDHANAIDPSLVSTIVSFLMAAISVVSVIITVYKARPERRKLEAESQSSLADAAESVAEGAKVSNELLLQRIKEMETREQAREQSARAREKAWSAELQMVQEQVQELKEELEAYKDWSFRLVAQVRGKGEEPVPFKAGKKKKES